MEKSSELIAEAKKNPNGWVYVLDREYKDKKEVPPEFIKGACKISLLAYWVKQQTCIEKQAKSMVLDDKNTYLPTVSD